MTRTVPVVLLTLAGVAYADWVLQLFLPVRADLTTSFISELGAAGQPYDAVFRAADLIGGALLVAGGSAAWMRTRRWAGTWRLLVLFGLCVSLEASLPLDATFTFAAILPRAGTHLWWARVTEPHGVVSLAETLTFLALFVSGTKALRRASVPARWRRIVTATGLAAILCGVVDSALTAALLMGGHANAIGLVQRVGVTLTAVWLARAPTRLVMTHVDAAGSDEPGQARQASPTAYA